MTQPVASVLFACLVAIPVLAQKIATGNNAAQNSPLSVTAVFEKAAIGGCDSAPAIGLQMRYEGTRPLRGYVIELTMASVEQKKLVPYPATDAPAAPFDRIIERAITSPSENLIQPGDQWTTTVCGVPQDMAEIPTDAVPRVDVLKFADATIWGGASLPQSNEMLGMFEGIDFITSSSREQGAVTPIIASAGAETPEGQREETQVLGTLAFTPTVERDPSGKDVIVVETRNQGEKIVRGYVYTLHFVDPNGRQLRQVTTKQIESHGDAAAYLAPGAIWLAPARKASLLDDGSPAQCKISLDLVLFADGSTQGPAMSRESHELVGIARGIDLAKGIRGTTPAASR
jgi:hypothetical protein